MVENCCTRMWLLEQALYGVDWTLLPVLLPLISDYALGHGLVSASRGEWKRIYNFPDIQEVATFDSFQEALSTKTLCFTVSKWRWLKIVDENFPAIISVEATWAGYRYNKAVIKTRGTALQIAGIDEEHRSCTMCLIGITEGETVKVGRFLMQHGVLGLCPAAYSCS